MSENLTDYHMTPYPKGNGEVNILVIIAFIIICLIILGVFIYYKYWKW